MGKFFSLSALLLLLSLCSYAQGHRLIVFSEDSTRFALLMNELQEGAGYAARTEVADIVEDRPAVRILFEDPRIPALEAPHLKLGDPRAANNPAFTAVYALRKSGRKYKLQLIRRYEQAAGHGVRVEERADGTSVEISNPGNVHIRVRK